MVAVTIIRHRFRSGTAKTAVVARPSEHGPAQRSDLHAEQAWAFVAVDLNDLATKFGCAT
ncbi:hypothetical protein SAMN05446635_3615 [Burkholderia sp. OK233]|nr:hypothetical protein SAMN05446635_3615 [Burkholderia sp. OK233]